MAAGKPVDQTANRKIWDDRQHHGNNEWLYGINPMEDNDFVNYVNDDGSNEYFAYLFPGIPEQPAPVGWIGKDGQKVWGTPCSRVSQSGADPKDDCNNRLDDDPKCKRSVYAANEIVPYALEH